jgi:hypothetical protein
MGEGERSHAAGHVDNDRARGLAQERQERVRHPDDPHDVDLEHRARVSGRELVGGEVRPEDTRVVDQDVDGTLAGADVGGGSSDRRVVGHIDLDETSAEGVGSRLPALSITSADDDGVAGFDQSAGGLVPEGLVGSGDECCGHASTLGRCREQNQCPPRR